MRLDGVKRRGEIEEHYSIRVTKSDTLQMGNTEVLVVLEWHPRYCDLFGISSSLTSKRGATFNLRSFRTSLSQTFIGTDVRAIGLRSFMQEITGFLGTGMIHDFFQIAGIDRLLSKHIYREH